MPDSTEEISAIDLDTANRIGEAISKFLTLANNGETTTATFMSGLLVAVLAFIDTQPQEGKPPSVKILESTIRIILEEDLGLKIHIGNSPATTMVN